MSWIPIAPWKVVDGTAQKISYTATAGTSNAVGAQTRAVLVSVTSDAHVKITQAGTAATTSDTLIKASWPPIVLGISPGDKVSAVQDAASGTLYVTELSH